MADHRLGPARDGRCLLCGRQATNWHERLPRGRGGLRDVFNSVRLCGSGTTGCHGRVTGNPEWARTLGLNVEGQMRRGVYVGADPNYRWRYNREVWWQGDWVEAEEMPDGTPRQPAPGPAGGRR